MILNNILDCKFQLLLQMNSVQWQKKLTAFDDHLQVSFRFLSILTIFDTSDFVFITFLFWNNPPPPHNTAMCHCTCEIRFRKRCKDYVFMGYTHLTKHFKSTFVKGLTQVVRYIHIALFE